jgi:hypothetical protein
MEVVEERNAKHIEDLRRVLKAALAPVHEQVKQLADHLRAVARPEMKLPPDVVAQIRREFIDNRH